MSTCKVVTPMHIYVLIITLTPNKRCRKAVVKTIRAVAKTIVEAMKTLVKKWWYQLLP